MALRLMSETDTIEVADTELGVPNGDKDVRYTMRPLTRDVYKRVIKPHTSKKPNPRTRQMEDVVNAEAAQEDLIDTVLVGWTGIVYDGQPAPCDREMKLKLDPFRIGALLEKAGLSQVVEEGDQTASFRRTP